MSSEQFLSCTKYHLSVDLLRDVLRATVQNQKIKQKILNLQSVFAHQINTVEYKLQYLVSEMLRSRNINWVKVKNH